MFRRSREASFAGSHIKEIGRLKLQKRVALPLKSVVMPAFCYLWTVVCDARGSYLGGEGVLTVSSFVQLAMSFSFLVVIVVVVRLYTAVRVLNARVDILSDLVRRLRDTEKRAQFDEKKRKEQAREIMEAYERDDAELQGVIKRDFSYMTTNRNRGSAQFTERIPSLGELNEQSRQELPAAQDVSRDQG